MTKGGDGGLTSSIENITKNSKLMWERKGAEGKRVYGQKMKKMWEDGSKRNQIIKSRKDFYINHPEVMAERSKKYTGDGNPNCKISEQRVKEIFELMNVGWLPQHIEERFGIDKDYIWELKTGKSWKYFDKSPYKNLSLFYRNNFSLNPDEIKFVLEKRIEGSSLTKIKELLRSTSHTIGRVLTKHTEPKYLINLKKVDDNIYLNYIGGYNDAQDN